MITALPNYKDLELAYMLVRERCDRFFPLIPYYRLVIALTEIDDVHMEIDEENKTFEDAIQLRAYMLPDNETYPLKKFGSEQVRNVVLTASVPHLIDVGLLEQDVDTKKITRKLKTGDRFDFGGYRYDVLSAAKGNLWGNTDIAIDFSIRAKRFRPISTEYTEL